MKLRIAIAAFALSSLGAVASSSISDAQQALTQKGFDVGPADGQMGTKTKAALKQFQQMQGLPASGQLDAQTLAALNVASSTPLQSQQQQQQQPPSPPTPQSEPVPQGSGFSPQGGPSSSSK